MCTSSLYLPTRAVLAMIGAVSLIFISSCGEQSASSQGSAANGTTLAKGSEVNALPRSGKLVSALAPPKAIFGMIWVNTSENREYIFDGAEWIPHDRSADDFYKSKQLQAKSSSKTTALVEADVCVDGDPYCTPTGAHGKHGSFDCRVCHKVGGRLAFDRNGPAYKTGYPAPVFDASTKSCSNVACHTVPPGTFSYYFPGGDGEPVLTTVSYGGGVPRVTPSWYATGAIGCSACHDNPPKNGSSGSNSWHSGFHGGQGPTGAYNQCQLCHPDASSPGNGAGDTITSFTLHVNGTVNVQAVFKSSCFGCH